MNLISDWLKSIANIPFVGILTARQTCTLSKNSLIIVFPYPKWKILNKRKLNGIVNFIFYSYEYKNKCKNVKEFCNHKVVTMRETFEFQKRKNKLESEIWRKFSQCSVCFHFTFCHFSIRYHIHYRGGKRENIILNNLRTAREQCHWHSYFVN